jgi:hypothetical protein
VGEHVLSAGSGERRMFWLQQLQRARREFTHKSNNKMAVTSQVG